MTGVLAQVLIFLGFALALAPLGKKLGLPVELSYLFIGVLLGPFALNLAGDSVAISHIGELGVVLFLFLIGLELQPARLKALRKPIALLGGSQVLLSGLLLSGMVWLLWPFFASKAIGWTGALVIGFCLSMSSTAFALQLLNSQNKLNSQHGRKAFAILLFQDIAVIPLLAIMPLLATGHMAGLDMRTAAQGMGILAVIVMFARYGFNPLFKYVASSNVPELFTVTALFVVLGAGWVMHSIGASMAMGTFIAGVLLANSIYRHQLVASIEPFKGLLLGLFFVSIGLNTPVGLFVQYPHWFVLAALGLMLLKAMVIVLVSRAYGGNWLVSVRLGALLAQGGEFAFVLFSSALSAKVLQPAVVEPLIMVVIVSIVLTPLLLWLVERYMAPRLGQLSSPLEAQTQYDDLAELSKQKSEVIIAGFGRIGQVVARVLRMRGVPFTAIDNNLRQVEFVRKHGGRVFYGHASSLNVLRAAGIEHAKIIVITISDQAEALKTVERIRQSFGNIKIYARARDRGNYYAMVDAGATRVWRETFAASMEISERILLSLGMEHADAEASIKRFKEYDEDLLLKQQAFFTDDEQLRQSAVAAHAELALLLANDRTLRQNKHGN